jgi:hypothetical protein
MDLIELIDLASETWATDSSFGVISWIESSLEQTDDPRNHTKKQNQILTFVTSVPFCG